MGSCARRDLAVPTLDSRVNIKIRPGTQAGSSGCVAAASRSAAVNPVT
jgi:hypothetical protein